MPRLNAKSRAGFPVDWKVPEPKVVQMHAYISTWARSAGQKAPAANDAWLKPWLARTLKSSQVNRPLVLLAVAGITLALVRLQRRIDFGPDLWLPLLPSFAWLLFWFFTAPDSRFARAPLWLLAAWLVSFAIAVLARICRWPEQRIFYALLALGAVLVFPRAFDTRSLVTDLGRSGFGVLPKPPLKEFVTRSGLKLFVPASDDRAWNAPLPSTPFREPRLELRGTTLREGFRLNPTLQSTNPGTTIDAINIQAEIK